MRFGTKFYVFFIANDIAIESYPMDMPYTPWSPVECEKYGMEPYAITKSKKYAEIFRNCRDMKYFMEKEIYVDETELESFYRDYMECIINKHPLTCMYQDGKHTKSGSVVIPIPEFEYDVVATSSVEIFVDMLMECEYASSEKFKELYEESTTILKPFVQKLFDNIGFFQKTEIGLYPEGFYGWDYYLKFNQLIMYSKSYGNTYRKGGLEKLCEYGDFI